MYTFVFIGNIEDKFPEVVLHSCCQITKKWMPSWGIELKESLTTLPECNCGWFWLIPASTDKFPLISEAIEERYAVIVFGDLLKKSYHCTAQIVLDAWSSGGSSKVRALDGCFSAVIVDRTNGKVTLISDPLGQRTLRYYYDKRRLIVSPHEIPLMATGYCPMEFDYVSACSIATVGWSLKGRSLLKHIETCHPATYVQWLRGQIQHFTDPIFNPDQRIDKDDYKAISENLECMIEIARENMRILVEDESDIMSELSAGIDSRAVLSLLLSVINPSQIKAVSVGEHNNLEVRVASQLAKMHGVSFLSLYESDFPSLDDFATHAEFYLPSSDDFVAHCNLVAFCTNGDSSTKLLSIKSLPKFKSSLKPCLCGEGGEIFRGNYYLYSYRPSSLQSCISISKASEIISSYVYNNIPRISWHFEDAIMDRLNAIINEYSGISSDGYDIMDMFYLYERFGVWGAHCRRKPWERRRLSPFSSRKLVRLAYMMPAPIANYTRIHQEFIRRFTPKAYLIRINGSRLLPLEQEGRVTNLLAKIDRKYQSFIHRTQPILNSFHLTNQSRGLEEFRADCLTNYLRDTVLDILSSNDSFAMEIVGKRGLNSLLTQHQNGNRLLAVDTLGCLICMEQWRTMVQKVFQEARFQNSLEVAMQE